MFCGFCISDPCSRCFTPQLVSQALFLGYLFLFCKTLLPVLGLFSACLNSGWT